VPRSSRQGDVLGLAVLTAAVVWLLWPVLLGGEVLSSRDAQLFAPPLAAERPAEVTRPSNPGLRDMIDIFEPDLFAGREDVRAGRLPTWTSEVGAGRPLLASQQAALMSPLQAPIYVLPFWRALGVVAALKLLLAAFGAFVLCRRLGLRAPAATLGGLSYALGTGFAVWLEHPEANVWPLLPWLLAAVDVICREERARVVTPLFGLGCGIVLLGGHPESAFVLGLTLVAWAAAQLLFLRRDGVGRAVLRARALKVAAGSALGIAVGAIATLPFLEALGQTSHIERSRGGDDWRILLGAVFPDRWGRTDKGIEHGGFEVSFLVRALYLGALPLLLAIAGLVVRRGPAVPRPRTRLFLAGMVVVSLAIVLEGPVNWLFGNLPVFSIMVLHWFVWPAWMAGAVLAAYGLQRLLDADPAIRRRMLAVMAGCAVLPLLVQLASPGFSQLGEAVRQLPDLDWGRTPFEVTSTTAALRWAIFAALACALVAAIAWRPRLTAAGVAALLALTAADLVLVMKDFHPSVPRDWVDRPAPEAIDVARASPGRVIGSGNALSANSAQLFGLRDVRSSNLPVIDRHIELYEALGGTVDEQLGRTYFDARRPGSQRLMDVFGVRHLFDDGRGPPPDGTLRLAVDRPEQRLWASSSALPRAYVAHTWRLADGEDEAVRMTAASSRGELVRAPVIEDAPPPAAAGGGSAASTRVSERNDTELSVEVNTTRPGYLVLGDTYFPGWKAEVDGEEAEILPANAAFRAVRVDAGRHVVTFEYRPLSVRIGLIVTLLGLLAIVGGLFLARRA
jgi:hypothetical protein